MSPFLDCSAIESWEAVFDGTLPREQRERCERHLESCPACQARLDSADDLGGLRGLVRTFGHPGAAPLDPILSRFLEHLHGVRSPLGQPASEPIDLYFLRPTDRLELLGTLG